MQWRWFLTLLLEDIGQEKRWVFISDQQKGLIPVFEEMFEKLEHRLCLRHLYANFKKKFGGGTQIRDLMMGAAKATYIQAYEKKMSELKVVNTKAWEWLVGHQTKLWCKHAFSFFSKCDVLMNNISEAFNSTILVARDKPIITMCEWIRIYLMNRMTTLRYKNVKYQQRIMPTPMKRLNREVELSAGWCSHLSSETEFQVEHHQHASSFIVNLDKRTCTCNFWELVGIPCRHAISAMGFSNQNPEDFVDHYYSREAYELCYSFSVSAINGQDMWPEAEVEVEDMLPPQYKRGPGRPKKMRRRDAHEDAKPRKQRPAPNRCTKCGNPGHNTRGCKSTEVNSDAQRRQRKPKKNVENASASNGFVNASTAVGTASNAAETASTAVSTARVVKAPIECLLDENDDNVIVASVEELERALGIDSVCATQIQSQPVPCVLSQKQTTEPMFCTAPKKEKKRKYAGPQKKVKLQK
ncbi:uncharacterized protein LOC123898916 [Trifolium pratense]|uniref:uncharacterized protein LOC123898916 n=1 Tax=Trifolium pratense TaxID=57577 RepID=UPI001E697617|nr:uncharacterized protein LOC123898916 [Trifolium pratense]